MEVEEDLINALVLMGEFNSASESLKKDKPGNCKQQKYFIALKQHVPYQ
jgi:hypothetical protein